MNTSDHGICFLKRKEQLRLIPYKDTHGIWTCGYGNKMAHEPAPGECWTREFAEAQFTKRLAEEFEPAVNQSIVVPMTQPQFDAMLSLAYNIGPHAFAQSSVARHMNAGKPLLAAEDFLLWNDHNSPGAIVRRTEERAIFLYGTPT